MARSTLLALAFAAGSALAQSPSSLNINDPSSLGAATAKALTNLMTYYTPNDGGVFSQVQTPWDESGQIWGTYMDYAKWTGDMQFMSTVVNALANASYNNQQDFLGGALVTQVETVLGRWNDDILWPSQAIVAGAEIYGPQTQMPGADGPWFTSAQKTYDEAWEQWDMNCSGGIYWSRDRTSKSAGYKSLITHLEFISQGARNYIQVKNDTALGLAERALNWVLGPSGLGNAGTGALLDGVDISDCSNPTTSLWSYNYGEMLGALAWMHKATGNSTYLSLATPFLNTALSTFAGSSVNGIVTELCEPAGNCNRDQQGFKAILIRNLAYLYRESSDDQVRSSIVNTIDTTVNGMIAKSCDDDWNCNGNWSEGAAPLKYVRSQHASAALLVAAMGVHVNGTGTGLLTDVNSTSPSSSGTGSSGGAVNSGWYTSQPYHAGSPPALGFRWPVVAWSLALALVGALLVAR